MIPKPAKELITPSPVEPLPVGYQDVVLTIKPATLQDQYSARRSSSIAVSMRMPISKDGIINSTFGSTMEPESPTNNINEPPATSEK